MEHQEEEKVTLNNSAVTKTQLEEEKKNLPGNQRIVEVDPNNFKTLTRLQE